MTHEKFTYDPTRAEEQFYNFVRLTFANSLKKSGKVEDKEFHFTDIVYRGPGIHQIMEEMEHDRFLLPKEAFMKINRSQMMAQPFNIITPPQPKRQNEKQSQGVKRGRGRPPKNKIKEGVSTANIIMGKKMKR